jgi:hypothetical protein
LTSLPEALLGDTSDYTDVWVDITSEDVEAGATLIMPSEDEGEAEISEEDIDNMVEFFTDDTIIKNVEFIDDEEIHGNKCNCIRATWNQDELLEVIRRASDIYDTSFDEEATKESLKEIEKLDIEACLGRSSGQIHRLRAIIVGTEEVKTNVEMEVIIWDYGVDIPIEVPEDTKTIEEYFSETPLATSAQDSEVKAEMANIQLTLEVYYAENITYPESLDVLNLEETEFYGNEVVYEKTEDGYTLSIVLPSGDLYELED